MLFVLASNLITFNRLRKLYYFESSKKKLYHVRWFSQEKEERKEKEAEGWGREGKKEEEKEEGRLRGGGGRRIPAKPAGLALSVTRHGALLYSHNTNLKLNSTQFIL